MIQIMDDLSPQTPFKIVYACFGTQLSKSTLNLILIAYRIDCRLRGPILAMHAVKEMAVAWAKDELTETIIANDYISSVLQNVKRGDDALLFKKWPGGSLITRGGASGTAFAKISAAMMLIDDLDRFSMNIGATTSGKNKKIGEGSPLELLFDRVTGRFGDYKIFANSSPKAEGESIIWPALKTTDQNHFYVKCPKCGLMQCWEFENLVFPHHNYRLTEEPYILCQDTGCKQRVYERDKFKVLQNWEYRPHSESLDPLTRGYRVSSLYSLLGYPFSQYAQDWLTACKAFDEEGDESKKIRHRNTKQARPWKQKVGKSVNHSALYKTMKNLDPLPENCLILACGIDLQKAPGRIECQVNGFGENDRYIVDHVVFAGSPEIKFGLEGSPWNLLADFLTNKRYQNSFEREQPIYCAAIDIAWAKDYAKDFLQRFEPLFFQQMFGVFGKEITKAAINFISPNSTKDIDGFESWGLYSNIKKVAIYNLLEKHARDPQNSKLHFSNRPCFTEQWFRQLTIEKMNEKGVLEKPHDHARNEALDCFDSKTEVLTSKGWKRFYDLDKTEDVATVNIDSDLIEYQKPTRYIEKQYNGEMIKLKGRRIDILVTPNHRMVVHRKVKKNGNWDLHPKAHIRKAIELDIHCQIKVASNWGGNNHNKIVIGGKTVNAYDWSCFLGFYVSEGCKNLVLTKNTRRKIKTVRFAQIDGWKADRLRKLLGRMPFKFSEHSSGGCNYWSSCNPDLFDALQDCGKNTYDKKVPEWMKKTSCKNIKGFLEFAIMGDGWVQDGHRRYCTVSEKLAGDMQELFIKSGSASNIYTIQPKHKKIKGKLITNFKKQYHVSELRHKKASLDSSAGGKRHFIGETVRYKGIVYCVSVPNGTLILRRNGKSFIAGNCMYLSDSAFLLAFREFENGPDWEDFREWNKQKILIDNTEKKPGIVGSVF